MTYKMDISEVCRNVFLVEMEKRNLLCRTFMRFQEHYESPEFRGKIFTRREYKKWYASQKGTDVSSYESDWSGFNIPSSILVPFYEGKFDPLLQCERKLLDQFVMTTGDFYVIGVKKGQTSVLTHEIAHGLWHTNSEYRNLQNKLLDSVRDHLEPLHTFLEGMGYCKEVLDDESHAYLVNDMDYLKKKKVDISRVADIQNQLVENYNKFAGEYSID